MCRYPEPEPDEVEPFWLPAPRASGRMEWTCPCGVGHDNHDHGCCGKECCARDDYPGRMASAGKLEKGERVCGQR